MSSMFDDFKEQVRSQANIVEIVSEYVPLKKRGSSYWGCCPFHGEKTPSFSVSPDKNFFYCFGCHAGGDVFTFIMKEENCTFQEALKILANKLGRKLLPPTNWQHVFIRPALPKASLANWRSVILLAGALRRKLSKNFLSACRCRVILRL